MTLRIPCSSVCLIVIALALAACPTASPRPGGLPFDDTGYPGLLRPPTVIPGDFVWQQRVTANWNANGTAGGESETNGFDGALQKLGDTMILVGLTPMGTKAFVVTQTGETVTMENHSGRDLRLSPRYVMLDIQRVFFPWLPAGVTEGIIQDDQGGERVQERYTDGKLVERCFERLNSQPAGRLCVAYEGWEPGQAAPNRAVLDNAWFGYQLIVETHAQTLL